MDNKPKIVDKNPQVKKPRNASFELLRIISMILIIASHFNNHGGFLPNTVGVNHVLANILQAVFVISVNLFVMISAYFMITQKFRWQRLLKLWIQVVFINAVIYIIFFATGKATFGISSVLNIVLPVLYNQYWFVSSYMVLMLLAPFLNIMLKNLTQKQHLLLCGLAVFFCIFAATLGLPIAKIVNLQSGYNAIWFVCLYVFAAYLRLHGLKIKKWMKITFPLIYLAILTAQAFGIYTSYSSFFTLVNTLLVFILFMNIRIKNVKFGKVLCFISSLTFGVYLIHDNSLIRSVLYKRIFCTQNFFTSPYAFLIMIGFILLTFVVCALLEWMRQLLFKGCVKVFRSVRKDSNKHSTQPPAPVTKI